MIKIVKWNANIAIYANNHRSIIEHFITQFFFYIVYCDSVMQFTYMIYIRPFFHKAIHELRFT